MIPVRIDRKPEKRDDYGHLGRYIAAAKEKGEKLDKFWIVNCDAGADLADLDTALIEIEALRTLKPEIADKTYHLVVSFHPEDQDKLSLEVLQDIERNFAQALGFGDHQRVAGTHINTDNFHMHIAFNKIHPVTGRCHTPRRDFKTLGQVARAMEQKYGLVVDKGITDGVERDPRSPKARKFEARTWQQSFESHVLGHKPDIMAAINNAKDWQALHDGLAQCDVELKKRGAGLVLAQIDGKGRMKASALDRSCSLAMLENRLGPFQPAQEQAQAKRRPPKRPYREKPLTKHPGTDRLWKAYRQERKPGFLKRVLHVRNWRDYLLAEAHKDALAMAIVLTYKELFHMLDEATTPTRGQYRLPRSMAPALNAWFSAAPWKPPQTTWLKRDLGDMDLKADDAGRVLFPMRDDKGNIWALRALDGQGRTSDVGDMAKPGLSHVIDPGGELKRQGVDYKGPVIIAADCLPAAALHKDSAAPVVVVPKDVDLIDMTVSIRARHPAGHIIIAVPETSRSAEQAAAISGGEVRVIDGVQTQSKIIAVMAERGKPVEVDAALARDMGAFVEDAVSATDVLPDKPKTKKAKAEKGKNGLPR